MKIILLSLLAMTMVTVVYGQNTFKATILDGETQEPLIGVNVLVETIDKGGVTDLEGEVEITNLPKGIFELHVSYIGYEEKEIEIILPQQNPIVILLEPQNEELETVTVTTTRSSRLIQDIPTRVEAISAEELGEKAFMNSTNISILLKESTGIQMQQTSANSANQSIRIQGLDGRYTQLLKDGFPLYGGFAGGLSIMQIPPLDLKQVEIIKGSASTLYGGGAIAGLVNLITRQPEEEPQLEFMLTQTQALGTTLNSFYAEQFGKAGVSLYTSGYLQKIYDVNDDDFSELPQVKSISINPTFFYNFDDNNTLRVGINSTVENRFGGDVTVVENSPNTEHIYTEENKSTRFSTQVSYQKKFTDKSELTIRNSINYFDRTIEVPDFVFDGEQTASFSEIAYTTTNERTDWVMGLNMWSDKFSETTIDPNLARDYSNNTFGVFGKSILSLTEKMALEAGLRVDYNTDYDWFVLPRISVLFDLNENWTSRIESGLGYKLPTIFSEDAETRIFQDILPITPNDTKAETSFGINWDINYKTILYDKISFSINNLLFYTQLDDPLVLLQNNNNQFNFENASGNASSKGLETNIKLSYGDFKIFLQYALIDAQLDYNGINRQKPLTPKHNAGGVLMYETEKWRIGFETYYTGGQTLLDLSPVEDYWLMGLLVAHQIGKFNVFVNFENFTDTRQSKFQDVVIPPHTNPSFSEIWSPTDGFIFSTGVRLKIFGDDDHH